MKNWRIKHRILLLALAPVWMISILLVLLVVLVGTKQIDDALQSRGKVITRQLAPASEYGAFAGNREVLQTLTQAVMREDDVKAVIITDREEHVLAISGKPSHFTHKHTAAALSGKIIPGDQDSLIFGAPILQGTSDINHFDLVEPPDTNVTNHENTLGYVYLELSTTSSLHAKNTFILSSIMIGLFGMGFASFISLRMSRDITASLLRLLDGVHRMAGGDLNVRIDQMASGELGDLEQGFNVMAKKLEFGHEKLQTINANLEQLVQQRTQELVIKNQALEQLSMTDSLTGIYNRLKIDQILNEEYARSLRYDSTFGIALIDIDKFKAVNDTYGHQVGDQVLMTFANILSENIRVNDVIGRWGGEEFLLICRATDLEGTIATAEKLRTAIADYDFRTIGIATASFGVACYQPGDTIADIIARSDTALYRAKESGRNCLLTEC